MISNVFVPFTSSWYWFVELRCPLIDQIGWTIWQNPSTVVSHKDIRNDVQQRRRLQTTQIWRCRYMLFKDIQRHCTIDIDSCFWHRYL